MPAKCLLGKLTGELGHRVIVGLTHHSGGRMEGLRRLWGEREKLARRKTQNKLCKLRVSVIALPALSV